METDTVALDAETFKRDLLGVTPHLRAFARGLCGNPDLADDLVQDTLMKAWKARDRFDPDSSIKAWTFVILRNGFLTIMRRSRFSGEYNEETAERIMVDPANQEDAVHLDDMHRALMQLPPHQREALLLIGASGLSYEEAAQICDCAIGTMKSRVSRARNAIAELLDGDGIGHRLAGAKAATADHIIDQAARLN